ncbi:MAG: ComF family protein [Gammaproteobacteria bacterium]|nr:ComF family protein [Gammaproteobacteria bacterium]MBU1624782.1 ComF family protein [Gammaproteobacteria bacterium]MBU1982626.1 ComF family protein [Gammaproteobacteria bacterium]
MSISAAKLLNIRSYFARLLPAQPCFLCGAASRDGLCCAACASDLPRHAGPSCSVCAAPLPSGEVCGRCLQHPPAYTRTVAAFRYEFPLDSLIKSLKFNEHLILANFLADALAARITSAPDYLLALPLYPTRLRERGFNQSQLIAARISHNLLLPVLTDAAFRIRDTPPQSSLPWRARNHNMRKAFALAPNLDVRDKHIAIVDDVMTTGASIDALATLLKQAGAKEVSAWVVARTLPHRGKS